MESSGAKEKSLGWVARYLVWMYALDWSGRVSAGCNVALPRGPQNGRTPKRTEPLRERRLPPAQVAEWSEADRIWSPDEARANPHPNNLTGQCQLLLTTTTTDRAAQALARVSPKKLERDWTAAGRTTAVPPGPERAGASQTRASGTGPRQILVDLMSPRKRGSQTNW